MSCSSSELSAISLFRHIPSLQQCLEQSDERLLSQICVRHFVLRDTRGQAPGGKLQTKKVEKCVRAFARDVVHESTDASHQLSKDELIREVCEGDQSFGLGEMVLLPYLVLETANSPLDIFISARADIALVTGYLSSLSIQYYPYRRTHCSNSLQMKTWVATDCEIYERYLGLSRFLWDCFAEYSWERRLFGAIDIQRKGSKPLTSFEFKLDCACAQTISHSLQTSLESINAKRRATARRQFERWIDTKTHPYKRVRRKKVNGS